MAALLCMILLSMVAVGLAAEGGASEGGDQSKVGRVAKKGDEGGEGEEEQPPLYAACCMADKLLPIVFKSGNRNCKKFLPKSHGIAKGGAVAEESAVVSGRGESGGGESGADDWKGGAGGGNSGADGGCMVECMLESNGLLDEGRSIKEAELRERLLREVDPEATPALGAALEKCFALRKRLDEEETKEGRKSSSCERAQNVFGCITNEILENCPTPFWRVDSPECRNGRPKEGNVAAAVNGEV